jgi:amidase
LTPRVDDADIYHGAPAAIQLIERNQDEERLISMAKVVVDALEKYKSKHGKQMDESVPSHI